MDSILNKLFAIESMKELRLILLVTKTLQCKIKPDFNTKKLLAQSKHKLNIWHTCNQWVIEYGELNWNSFLNLVKKSIATKQCITKHMQGLSQFQFSFSRKLKDRVKWGDTIIYSGLAQLSSL